MEHKCIRALYMVIYLASTCTIGNRLLPARLRERLPVPRTGTQPVPLHTFVLQATDGGGWWIPHVDRHLFHSVLLSYLDGRDDALRLVGIANVAYKESLQYSRPMDSGVAGSCRLIAADRRGYGLLDFLLEIARPLLRRHHRKHYSFALGLAVSVVAVALCHSYGVHRPHRNSFLSGSWFLCTISHPTNGHHGVAA